MALIGHGSSLVIVGPVGGATGSEVNLSLACLSIDPGSNKIDAPDVTDMLTPGQTRVYQPGMESPGDVTVKYNSNPTNPAQAALFAAKGQLYLFQVVYPGGAWYEFFEGIVTSVDETIPDDKPITRTAKIQKSGPTTESATAPATAAVPTAQTTGY